MISSFLGTLYNITDMAWIGLLGSKAVALVGVGGMYVWLSQGLASLARMGGQVHVAQCLGRGDKEQAHRYAKTAVQTFNPFRTGFAAVSLLFTDPLVGFFKLEGVKNNLRCKNIYAHHLRSDPVFLFKPDTDRIVYGAGRF